MTLPKAFLEQMTTLLGDEFSDFLASYEDNRHYGLRFNDLKGGPMDLTYETTPVPWCSEGRYYGEDQRPAKEGSYYAGRYYIQEPSAMAPGSAIDAQPGEMVIDLCAAPGGKTTQMASAMGNEGLIVTNDISVSRVKNLNKNVQISGIRNALVISEDPKKLAGRWQGIFDKVLVDAPCSGEGMFRKEPKLMASWEEKGPDDFVELQRSILADAYTLLKPGGTLVYSTCTYNLDENEGNIAWFLNTYPDAKVVPVWEELKIAEGFSYDGDDRTKGCGRLWPHKLKGEGHFVAKLLKAEAEEGHHTGISSYALNAKADKSAIEGVKAFIEEVGITPSLISLDRLNVVKDTVYLLPEIALDNKGLRTFANGWLLGTMKKGRFEPSQAFASGLMAQDVKSIVDYSGDSTDAIRYLKGETLTVETEKGWHLVTVDGAGIGWGKVVNKRLKNKLEPSWRWQ